MPDSTKFPTVFLLKQIFGKSDTVVVGCFEVFQVGGKLTGHRKEKNLGKNCRTARIRIFPHYV